MLALFYLVGSIYGFMKSDLIDRIELKILLIASMVITVLAFNDLYRQKFKLTRKLMNNILYNVGLLLAVGASLFMYSTLVRMAKKLL